MLDQCALKNDHFIARVVIVLHQRGRLRWLHLLHLRELLGHLVHRARVARVQSLILFLRGHHIVAVVVVVIATLAADIVFICELEKSTASR